MRWRATGSFASITTTTTTRFSTAERMGSLAAIQYNRGTLRVLNQLLLPHEFIYDEVATCEAAFDCIRSMRVRGAPAIAIVAALTLAVELEHKRDATNSQEALVSFINARLDYLLASRPTAVDLSNAIKLLKATVLTKLTTTSSPEACAEIRDAYITAAEKILEDDLTTNLAIGRYGAEYLMKLQPRITGNERAPDEVSRKLSVLTHCNTGSLATSGHGTALGIIRSLHKMNCLRHAYCTETRPYNQGSRLTAFELVYESIPSTLITDSMAGALFARKKDDENIVAVIVGADRVTRNGDTANKIGTYGLAVLAKHHGIKFIVAAPTTSIDLRTVSGADIHIENRPSTELTQVTGAVVDEHGAISTARSARVAIADQRIGVWNPAFDVTPAALIDAIITEHGEVLPNSDGTYNFRDVMNEDRWKLEVGF
ncbi:Methylthioribose-1-phosphate isomerase [Podosphaera aphanis]|nr:Methylthioribose-1-phosphate isomerase [Podosphaera aphanis]